MAHFHKFIGFLDKNFELPFIMKKRIFDACLMSGLLYGCESWLNGDIKPVCKLYNWALKQMLGVRHSTCNDMCYVESGYSSLKAIIQSKQRKFFVNMYNERCVLNDDPLGFVLKLVLNSRYRTKNYLTDLINNSNVNDINRDYEKLKNDLSTSNSSRRIVYSTTMNSSLSVHNIYLSRENIPEYQRVAFTRFRLAGHSLAVETGRWNRRGRGRLPMEERLCSCGQIQSEVHVLTHCPMSQHIRDEHNFISISDLLDGRFSNKLICEIIFKILRLYE